MKRLRGMSLTFLTIGGIFSALLFGILIILINKINKQMLLYNAAYMLLEDIAILVLQFSNEAVYKTVREKPELVGGILIVISSFLVLMYLIPNYLSKNNSYKGFGVGFAFTMGLVSCVLLSMAVYLTGQPLSYTPGLNIFKLDNKSNIGFILLFIGPILTFLGGFLAIIYYSKTWKINEITQDEQNRLTAINLETNQIGARGLTLQKEMASLTELPSYEEAKRPVNKTTNKTISTTDELKAKMAVLKAKMAHNAIFNEEGEAHLLSEEDDFTVEAEPSMHLGEEGQYLRTKDGDKIVDESPVGLLLEKEGNFVQKGDVIKHRDYSAPIFDEKESALSGSSYSEDSIIIPKSKQNMPINTTDLVERIGSVPKPSGKQRVNPNARVDSSYDGKVFLGDIDKIWTAGKKYREDITKKPPSNESSQSSDLHNNVDGNGNYDTTDDND